MTDHREALLSVGLDLAAKPAQGVMPTLPEDPTAVSDEDLMGLFFELTEWGCYARAQTVDATIAERWAERGLALRTAEAITEVEGKTLADRKSSASLTDGVLDAEVTYVNAWAKRKAVDEAAETAERRAAALSRELSRRGAKAPRSSRWSS